MKALPKYIKINILVLSISLIFILTLTIGYSILSKELNINGSVLLSGESVIAINSASSMNAVGNAVEVEPLEFYPTTISTNIRLIDLNSTASYELTIKNNSSGIMSIKSINMTASNNADIVYTITGVSVSTTFIPNEEKPFTLSFSYSSSLEEVPSLDSIESIIEITFEEYAAQPEYVSTDLQLDLRGTDAPINNVWYDKTTQKAMTLSGATYDNFFKYYTFTDSAYGTLGYPIIPTTGDFTLEVRFTYPIDVTTTTDQAIVAQVAEDANDDGRFKLNAIYKNNSKSLLVFYNDTNKKTSVSANMTTSPVLGKVYSAQIVRRGSNLELYLDGEKVLTNTYNTAAFISQGPFKIAKWNSKGNQPYHGNIYSIRLYERALEESELSLNRSVDDYYYTITDSDAPTIYEYARRNYGSANGGSLYLDNLGNYVFRGIDPPNYLRFLGSDKLYRIISFGTDDSMKIVDTQKADNYAFDVSGNRKYKDENDNIVDSYCLGASSNPEGTTDFYGCNYFGKGSVINTVSEGTVTVESSSAIYLNNTYYNTLPNSIKGKILTHSFAAGFGIVGHGRDATNTDSLTQTWNGKIGMVTIADIINSSENELTVAATMSGVNNFITNLKTGTDFLWTMTGNNVNTFDVFAINGKSTVASRRASRFNQSPSTMYLLPAFYVKSDGEYSGNGTLNNPFIIK